jgi:hypothetical protein
LSANVAWASGAAIYRPKVSEMTFAPCFLAKPFLHLWGSETIEITAVLLAKCVKRTDASKRDESYCSYFGRRTHLSVLPSFSKEGSADTRVAFKVTASIAAKLSA